MLDRNRLFDHQLGVAEDEMHFSRDTVFGTHDGDGRYRLGSKDLDVLPLFGAFDMKDRMKLIGAVVLKIVE